ncbi:MAG TPA: DUF6427 family protein [Cyclobacteriaceae bacterium]
MLRYFRINDPYRLIGLLVIAGILFIPPIVDSPPMSVPELLSILIGEKITEGAAPFTGIADTTGPLAAWFYGLMDLLFGRGLVARHVVAFFIILSQAVYIGSMFINRKVFSESTYVPSLVYIVFMAFSYDTLALTGELIGLGFLLLALSDLLSELEFRTKRDDRVLALGFFVSLASLCSFEYWLYYPVAGIIIILYSRRDLRVFLLLTIGFALPHLLLITLYYVAGDLRPLMQYFYVPNLKLGATSLMAVNGLIYLSLIPALFLAAAIVVMNSEARFSKYQSQVFQSMLLWTAFSVIYVMHTSDRRPQSMIALFPPLSYFVSHLFLLIRRRRLAEWSLWTFLIGIFLVSTLSRYGKIEGIDYDRLQVSRRDEGLEGKKVLVLTRDVSWYAGNSLATPFLDWSLAEPIFADLDYYENVITINEGFRDRPDVIIDPDRRMDAVFDRIPRLRDMYREEESGKFVAVR